MGKPWLSIEQWNERSEEFIKSHFRDKQQELVLRAWHDALAWEPRIMGIKMGFDESVSRVAIGERILSLYWVTEANDKDAVKRVKRHLKYLDRDLFDFGIIVRPENRHVGLASVAIDYMAAGKHDADTMAILHYITGVLLGYPFTDVRDFSEKWYDKHDEWAQMMYGDGNDGKKD